MKINKLKICAAAAAAALLFGGLFLLFRDDVGEMIQEEKIKPFVPDFTLLKVQEDNDQEEENTADISSEAEEKLKEQTQELCNSIDNSVGWINIPETKINYPVMYSGDNEFYLHRAVDGSYLRVGSIFLDYRCNADFTGKINILYGHNMSDGSMFADVMKFIDSGYFDGHNYGWLTTENSVYKIDFFSLSQPENYDDFYNVNSDVSLWLDDLRINSFIWRNWASSQEIPLIELRISSLDDLQCLSICFKISSSSYSLCDKIVLMIAEDVLPKISEKTISNLQLPTVRAFVNLFFSEVRILVNLYRYRVSSLRILISLFGIKLPRTIPSLKRSAIHLASLLSSFSPLIHLTHLGLATTTLEI